MPVPRGKFLINNSDNYDDGSDDGDDKGLFPPSVYTLPFSA